LKNSSGKLDGMWYKSAGKEWSIPALSDYLVGNLVTGKLAWFNENMQEGFL